MKYFIHSLFLLLTSVSICEAQYDSWTHIRILPESTIDDFEPISETEILALSKGIIYYSDDIGESWDLLIEREDDPISAIKSDANGNYYFKTALELYKVEPNTEPALIKEDTTKHKLLAVEGDTIIMQTKMNLVYTLNGGQSWNTSDLFELGSIAKVQILGDNLVFKSDKIYRYEFSNNLFSECNNIYIDETLKLDFVAYEPFSLVGLIKACNPIGPQGMIMFENEKECDPINLFEPLDLPWKDSTHIYRSIGNDIITFSDRMGDNIPVYVSSDRGATWTTHIISDFYNEPVVLYKHNSNCPYAFVMTDIGRLFRTSNPLSANNNTNSLLASIQLTPNPTNDYFKIKMTGHAYPMSVAIYDIDRRILKSYENVKTNQELSLEGYPYGVYLVQIVDSKGITQMQQVVKSQQ